MPAKTNQPASTKNLRRPRPQEPHDALAHHLQESNTTRKPNVPAQRTTHAPAHRGTMSTESLAFTSTRYCTSSRFRSLEPEKPRKALQGPKRLHIQSRKALTPGTISFPLLSLSGRRFKRSRTDPFPHQRPTITDPYPWAITVRTSDPVLGDEATGFRRLWCIWSRFVGSVDARHEEGERRRIEARLGRMGFWDGAAGLGRYGPGEERVLGSPRRRGFLR